MPIFMENTMIWTILYFTAAMLGCFWGYRLQKQVIAFVVFIGAYMLMHRFGGRFVPYPNAVTGLAIVIAFIAAGLSFHLYFAGLFAMLALAGISIARMWIVNEWIALFVGVAAGCVLGLLAVRMNRMIVIVVTGIVGGLMSAKYGALLLVDFLSFTMPSQTMLLVVGAIFAAAGIWVQFQVTPRAAQE